MLTYKFLSVHVLRVWFSACLFNFDFWEQLCCVFQVVSLRKWIQSIRLSIEFLLFSVSQQMSVTSIISNMINRKIVTVTKCFVIVKLILCKEQKRLRGTVRAAALHYQIQSQSICFLHGIVYFRTFLIMPEFLWEIQSSDGAGYR